MTAWRIRPDIPMFRRWWKSSACRSAGLESAQTCLLWISSFQLVDGALFIIETRDCIASIDDAKLEAVGLCMNVSHLSKSFRIIVVGGWEFFLLHPGNFRPPTHHWKLHGSLQICLPHSRLMTAWRIRPDIPMFRRWWKSSACRSAGLESAQTCLLWIKPCKAPCRSEQKTYSKKGGMYEGEFLEQVNMPGPCSL